MPAHPDRVRRHYEKTVDRSLVSTAVIKLFERDIKYLLDHTDHASVDHELIAVRKRLRRFLRLFE